MAFALSCKLSDRIAAVGAVAAAQSLEWVQCGDSKPVIANGVVVLGRLSERPCPRERSSVP
jgi:hypothetical protein